MFDAARNHLVGRRTRRVIRLGDQVTVQVAKVDTFKKQVDFRLAGGATAGVGHPLKARPIPSEPTRRGRHHGRGVDRVPRREDHRETFRTPGVCEPARAAAASRGRR